MAVAAPAASAQAPDYTIRATGSKTGLGKVSAIGPFKLDSDPNLAGATAAFGSRRAVLRTDTRCAGPAGAMGLRISFVNFGGGDSCQFGKRPVGRGLRRESGGPRAG